MGCSACPRLGRVLVAPAYAHWLDTFFPPVYAPEFQVYAKQGYDKIGGAGYLGTHWIATYALMYENLANLLPLTTNH